MKTFRMKFGGIRLKPELPPPCPSCGGTGVVAGLPCHICFDTELYERYIKEQLKSSKSWIDTETNPFKVGWADSRAPDITFTNSDASGLQYSCFHTIIP